MSANNRLSLCSLRATVLGSLFDRWLNMMMPEHPVSVGTTFLRSTVIPRLLPGALISGMRVVGPRTSLCAPGAKLL
jgi:hypothetical protein